MSNTLTGLIPTIYTALDTVSREQVGFIPAVSRNAKADAAAKGTSVTAPVAPAATTVDITPGATAPNDGDQTIDSVEVKITKSKMAPVKWNGEEQLALGPAGTYNTILADQFKQAFRALSNEVDADLGALYYATSRAVGTAGTTPFGMAGDLSDAANARQVMSDNGSPTTDLQMVLGSSAIANLRGKQSVLFKVNESGTDALLREGIIGRLEGFNIHESAGVKKHASAATGYLVNGAKEEGDILVAVDTGTGVFKAGDVVMVKAGTIHAIGAGVFICEIQQNSNCTYRMYDYDRRDKFGNPRELHVKKALDVVDNHKYVKDNKTEIVLARNEHFTEQRLVQCKYFEVFKYEVTDEVKIAVDEASFVSVLFISGKGSIETDDYEKVMPFKAGESFFISAGQRGIIVKGQATMIVTRV